MSAPTGAPYSSSARVESFGDYFSWRAVGLFAALYLVGISNSAVMTIVLLGLLVWSLTGTTQAIMAMSLVAMLKFANGAIASFSPLATALFWLITMAASLRLLGSGLRVTLPLILLLTFAIVATLLSILVSKAPDVSLMKVLSFVVVSSALLVASQNLRPSEILWMQRWFFSMALVMVLLSIATIPFPGIAFQRVSSSLQGMFNHPQTAGIFFVPFASWFIARIFLEQLRFLPRWLLVMAAVLAGFIVASGARTAMFATFVSVGVTLLIALIKGHAGPASRTRGELIGFTSILFSLAIAILLSGVMNEELKSVVLKDENAEDVGAAFEHSRGAGMVQQFENFLDAPLTGHGFGVYREGVSGGEANIKRFFGIPISASAEKGVAFTSVLEEVGIFGALLFYALLIAIATAVARGPSPGALAMVLGCIAVNFGEAIIFSTGGMGLLMWLLMGFGLTRARLSDPAAAVGPVPAVGSAIPPSNLMR